MPRNIARVDHHHFHGFVVCIKRRPKLYERYFRDNGDPAATLRKAIRFRDRLLLTLPPPRKFHTRSRASTTGVVGVHVEHERARKRLPTRYRAFWIDEAGRAHSRSFSVKKYGQAEAFARAVETRKRAIEQLLRPKRPKATPILQPRSRTL